MASEFVEQMDADLALEDRLTSGELAVATRSFAFNSMNVGLLAGIDNTPEVDSFSDEELAKTARQTAVAPNLASRYADALTRFRETSVLNTVTAASAGEMSVEAAAGEISRVDEILQDPSGSGIFSAIAVNRGQFENTPEIRAILESQPGIEERVQELLSEDISELEKNLILNSYGEFLINALSNQAGVWDTVQNIGGLFIPDRLIELDELGETFGIDLSDINAIVGSFQALSPETRAALLPSMMSVLLDNVDKNEIKAIERFGELMGEGFGTGEAVAFDILDAVPIVGAIAKVVTRGSSIIRTVKAFGNSTEAGRLNAKVLTESSDAAASSTNTTRATAQANTHPANLAEDGKNLQSTDDIAAETVLELEKDIAIVRDKLEDIRPEHLGLVTAPERLVAQQRAVSHFDEIAKEAGLSKEIGKTAKPRIVNERVDGFDLEITTRRNAKGQFSSEGTTLFVPIRYTRNDIGAFDAINLGKAASTGKILSPSAIFTEVLKDINLVGRATVLEFKAAAAAKQLRKIARASLKGLNKKSRDRIDNLLLQGDDAARTFSLQELMIEGVATETGIHKFTKAEASAYYQQRVIFDEMFFLKNDQLRRTLEFDDFRALDLNVTGAAVDHSTIFVGKVGKENALRQVQRIYDPELKKIVDIGDDLLASKLIDDTYNIVATKAGRQPVGVTTKGVDGAKSTEYFTHSIVKDTDLAALPDYVLQYRHGYVPLVRDGVYYVVRSGVKSPVNGVEGDIIRTERFFNGRKEAAKWVEQQNKLVAKESGNRKFFEPRRDRDLGADELEENAVVNFGGLFGSARSSREILMGMDGTTPIRLNAFASLEKNLNHIAFNGTMNQFRMDSLQRLKNSIGKDLKDPTDLLNSSASKAPVKGTVDAKRTAAITRLQEYYRDILRIPSGEERVFERTMVILGEQLEGAKIFGKKVPDNVRTAFLDTAAVDPTAKMRGLTFHALLGAFNPAQLLVQSQAATIAFTLAPQKAPKFIAQYMALRHIVPTIRNTLPKEVAEAVATSANKATKGSFASEAAFIEMAAQFKRSGLMDSIRTSADFEASLEGFTTSGSALKNVMDKGLFFFREGEIFGRTYSWLLARDEWLKLNPGKKIDAFAEATITARSVDFTLNLNRANRANWQSGILSIPLQFKQVTAKYAEALFGLNAAFSKRQRAAIVTGQLGLYGLAGIPIGGDWLAKNLLNSVGVNFGELSEQEQAAAVGGAWELMADVAFGERINLGDRFSLAQGIEEVLQDLTDPDIGLDEVAFGAFGTIPHRAFQAVHAMSPLFIQPTEFEWAIDDAVIAVSEFGKVFSSWNNAHQAYTWWQLQTAVDSKGRRLFPINQGDDLNLVLAKALGFQPRRVMDIQVIKQFNRNVDKHIRETVDSLTFNANNFMRGDVNDPERIRRFKIGTAFLLNSLPAGDARSRAFKAYTDRIFNGDTEENKAMKRLINNILAGGLELEDSFFNPDPRLTVQGQEE